MCTKNNHVKEPCITQLDDIRLEGEHFLDPTISDLYDNEYDMCFMENRQK